MQCRHNAVLGMMRMRRTCIPGYDGNSNGQAVKHWGEPQTHLYPRPIVNHSPVGGALAVASGKRIRFPALSDGRRHHSRSFRATPLGPQILVQRLNVSIPCPIWRIGETSDTLYRQMRSASTPYGQKSTACVLRATIPEERKVLPPWKARDRGEPGSTQKKPVLLLTSC